MAIDEGNCEPGTVSRDHAESGHIVQFYESDEFLANTVGDFLAEGIQAGEAAIAVATVLHRDAIRERLRVARLNVVAAEASGQYVAFDAAELLASFMDNGAPNPDRFAEIVGGLLARKTKQYRRVRVFGEMVALLAMEGNHSATIRLEQLWNELRGSHSFSLLCAYPMHRLGGQALAATFDQICAEHCAVIPAEDYTALTQPNQRRSAVAALQQKARWLEVEIADRQKVEERLRSALEAEKRARRVAEDALRARDEFLAGAAHELKTPLTVLLAQAQLTVRRLSENGSCEPERITHSLREIARQGDTLAHRINQLLVASQLDDHNLVLEREPTDLVAMVKRLVSRPWVDLHPIYLTGPSSLLVVVDSHRFEQVLVNLLDNAVRYSPDGGPIEVQLTSLDGQAVELAIRDHGFGVPVDKRGHLFDLYSAAHGEEYRSGMGLGLAISRRIVELHGGELRAEFPLDGGSRFIVHLPMGSGVGDNTIA